MVELTLVVLIIGLLTSIALPLYGDAKKDRRRTAFLADSRQLMNAMASYREDEGKYPAETELDLQTLEPLGSRGYLDNPNAWLDRLQDGRLQGYLAPDVSGEDSEYAIFFVTGFDGPTGMLLLESATPDGVWRSGVYVTEGTEIVPVDDAW